MSPAYKIFGVSVKPHILAIGTLAATGAGVYFGLGKNEGKDNSAGNASASVQKDESSDIDVEKLLGQFLESDTEKK